MKKGENTAEARPAGAKALTPAKLRRASGGFLRTLHARRDLPACQGLLARGRKGMLGGEFIHHLGQ